MGSTPHLVFCLRRVKRKFKVGDLEKKSLYMNHSGLGGSLALYIHDGSPTLRSSFYFYIFIFSPLKTTERTFRLLPRTS